MLPKPSSNYLVRLLAAHEAPWLPIRQHWDAAPSIHARRDGVACVGLAGGAEAARQQTTRQRTTLIEHGLVIGLKISPAGIALARGMSWPYTKRRLTAAVKRLTTAVADGNCVERDGVPFVAESLIGNDDCQSTLLLLPLLADGALLSRSTPLGEAFFGLAPGVNIKAAIATATVAGDGEFDAAAADDYVKELIRCRRMMIGDQNYYPELGELPIAGWQGPRDG